MKKTAVYFLIMMTLVFSSAGCGKSSARKDKEEAIPVKVMKVKLENLNKALEYVGNIEGQDEAVVYPKISGKIIEKVKEEGSPISKGDVIAYIDRDEVGLKFERAPVESPLSGTVGRVYVDLGSNVTPQTPIALVSNTDKVEINLGVPEKYLPDVSIGQDAEIAVDAYPNEKFAGKVSRMSPVVDIQTRTAPIEIIIDNKDHRLQSGMFAKVKLTIKENKHCPAVLKESVMGRGADTYVYVVEGTKAILKKVSLGNRHGAYYEICGGVKEGDLVVIMGQQRLRDGAPVEAEEW